MNEKKPSIEECDITQDHKYSMSQPTRTPLYRAMSDDRYHRQAIIKQIQENTSRSLISYISGNDCRIDMDDTMPFVDLLHRLEPNQPVDFLLHTLGGDLDVAEKLIGLLRDLVGTAELRIIVPDYAKSAGTLMVLGADKVVMSDMSELGPIDPQMPLFGNWQSVQNYLDAYKAHKQTLESNPDDVSARIMLGKLDPTTVKLCEAQINRASQAAEKLLKRGMFRNTSEPNWTRTVSELLNTRQWLSHGQMISWEDAQDPKLGLIVEYMEYHAKEWQDF